MAMEIKEWDGEYCPWCGALLTAEDLHYDLELKKRTDTRYTFKCHECNTAYGVEPVIIRYEARKPE
ncbi:MAG: hypothetical protein ACFFCW_08790 [Candidatus Hodarchaeota archaeon]